MVDVGHGPPLVLVPGIQGRWEWMRPTVGALAWHLRVLTFTLAGERASDHAFDPRLGFDNFVVQIDRVLEEAGLDGAVVCGVSYGGLIAARYAALRPDRVRGLVLVSALAPDYRPDRRVAFYLRAPRLLSPLFGVGAFRRASVEMRTALPDPQQRLRFAAAQLTRIMRAPMSPARMRDRMRLLAGVDFVQTVRRIAAPALVVTGESALDRAVPVEQTRRYLDLLPDAEAVVLARTGHLGLVTRADEFAEVIAGFVRRTDARSRAYRQTVAG
jgi:3-oxoadipate enol-lactonase